MMNRYVVHRLLLLIPTFILISVLAFFLRESAPGDPVRIRLHDLDPDALTTARDTRLNDLAYRRTARELHLDLPAFYLTIEPSCYPDTLYRILPLSRRNAYAGLCRHTGDPGITEGWFRTLIAIRDSLWLPSTRPEVRQVVGPLISRLMTASGPIRIRALLAQWPDTLNPAWRKPLEQILPRVSDGWAGNVWWPSVHWHGLQNRYHLWMAGFIGTDTQVSWVDSTPVWSRIWPAAKWTLLMNGLALIFAYLLSIPFGVWMATRAGSSAEEWVSLGLYALYSVPGFWLGTLLLVFLTTPAYGLDWFPSIGLGDLPPGAGFWTAARIRTSHLILPVFCLTYGSLAYLTRHIRNGMVRELRQEYIRAAWVRGLTRRQVIWHHAFRNALFPLITLSSTVLPATLAGSVAIEIIFNIPGMGRLTYGSILSQDWPVVYALLFLAASLTLTGSLLADWLYSRADPRVRWGRSQG